MQRARLAVQKHDARQDRGVVALDPAGELVERLLERGGARDQLVDAVLGREQVADPLGLVVRAEQPDDGFDRDRRVLERLDAQARAAGKSRSGYIAQLTLTKPKRVA